MTIYNTIGAIRGYVAHVELLCEFPVECVKVGHEWHMRSTETKAILFAGLGHGLAIAYHEWLGENPSYLDDDRMFERVADIAGEEITQEQYDQLVREG